MKFIIHTKTVTYTAYVVEARNKEEAHEKYESTFFKEDGTPEGNELELHSRTADVTLEELTKCI